MRILVADRDEGHVTALTSSLEMGGHVVDAATNAVEVIWRVTEVDYDAVLLDVAVDPVGGIEVCRQLRHRGCWVPVVLTSAHGAVQERVDGLDAGADDYLVKPFAVDELRARLRAIVRRGTPPRPTVLRSGDLEVDPATRLVSRAGVPISLSAREFAMLELFLRHEDMVLTRAVIKEKLWDFAAETGSNVVDVTVRRLRRKIDVPFGAHSIWTVRGAGYRYSRSSEHPQTAQRPTAPGDRSPV